MRKLPPTFLPPDSNIVYCYLYKFIVAVLACFGFHWCFKHWAKQKIVVLNYFGHITLGIYAIYISFLGFIGKTLAALHPYSLPYVLLVAIVSLFATYLVYLLLDTNRYTAFLFLGVSPARATPVPSDRKRPCRNKKTK